MEYGASAVTAGSLFSFYGNLKAVLINYPTQKELDEHVYNYQDSLKKELRILHLTTWYPNKYNTQKALFIKENFDALNEYCTNYLLHFEINVRNEKKEERSYQISENEETIYLNFPFQIWFFIELISFIVLLKYLISKKIKRNYDVINLHIAYPFGVYINLIKRIFKKPVLISEHWTAYHFNFYLNNNKAGLNRIKNIFKHQIPIITVSEALAEDIRQFSNQKEIKFYSLFNVVNPSIFNCKSAEYPKEPTFFMLNMWSKIKQPFIGIDAFEQFLLKYGCLEFRICIKLPWVLSFIPSNLLNVTYYLHLQGPCSHVNCLFVNDSQQITLTISFDLKSFDCRN